MRKRHAKNKNDQTPCPICNDDLVMPVWLLKFRTPYIGYCERCKRAYLPRDLRRAKHLKLSMEAHDA